MRYQIGEKYPFVYVEYTSAEPVSFGYRPWMDKLVKIHMVVLTCTEHHKVAWEYDPTNEKKYDGFVFTDEQDRVWHNQYPVASYGQLDNSGDFMVFPKSLDDMTDVEGFNFFTLGTRLLDMIQVSFNRGDDMATDKHTHEEVATGMRTFRNSLIEMISIALDVEVAFVAPVRGGPDKPVASNYVRTRLIPRPRS